MLPSETQWTITVFPWKKEEAATQQKIWKRHPSQDQTSPRAWMEEAAVVIAHTSTPVRSPGWMCAPPALLLVDITV